VQRDERVDRSQPESAGHHGEQDVEVDETD
jgi:hypothetical protein